MDRSVRVDVSLLDELMNLVGELVVDRGQLDDIAEILRAERHSHEVAARLTRVTERIGRVTAALQSTVLRARMLPVERIFSKFPRLVRDVSRQLGKKVELIITGEDTELDRRVLQQIGDPLMHLIRNALDHGLETPE
ncbi:MAG: chemotaxis protein CheA, partial [Planifilum fulgidum]